MRQKIVAVDFDGTMFDNPETEYPDIGEPKWNVINKVKEEHAKGAKIILFTLRDGYALRMAFEKLEEVGLGEIITEYIPNKPFVDEFWDDRNRNPDDEYFNE